MKNIYFHMLAIVIVGLIAYSNSFSVPFQFDDIIVIEENPMIKDISNFSLLKVHEYNPREDYNSRRYLGYLSLALNYRYGGLDVTSYHITNFLIHLINGILVYFFVILTFKTPYFTSEKVEKISKKSVVSSKQEEEKNEEPGTDGFSLFTTHNSLFTTFYSLLTSNPSQFIALFSALLFVAHPVQTQAVTYIVQRFTSLTALFYLLSVVMYIKGRTSKVKSEKSEVSSEKAGNSHFTFHVSRLTIVWYLLSLISAVCAMKVKEISFTMPLMILLYEFTFFKSTLKRKLVFLVPILLTLIVVPLSVLHIDKPLGEVLSDISEKSRLQTDISRGDYLMTEMRVIVTYIRLIFMPVNQKLDYDYPLYHSFFSPPVFLSFLLLSALFGVAVYLLYKSRRETTASSEKSVVSSEQTEAEATDSSKKLEVSSEQAVSSKKEEVGNAGPNTDGFSLFTTHYSLLIGFGILWFFLALSVESSFVPIVDVIFEHRLYLPSIGAFVALSAALFAVVMKAKNRWPGAEKALIPLVLIIVLMLSSATFARNRVWQDKTRLWEDVVRKSPGNARAHNNLCFVYIENRMNDQAIQQCRAALGLIPNYLDAGINLGIAYNAKGMYDQAIEQFLIALSMAPDDADAHNNLGIAYVSKGKFDEAITHYQIALRLWPDYAEAYNNLGVAYGSKGMTAQAIENFEHAIRLKADYFEANYNLTLILEKIGDHDRALEHYNKANEMKPADNLP